METIENKDTVRWKDPVNGSIITRTRLEIIHEMKEILETECPWIFMDHSESYLLRHQWVSHLKIHPLESSLGILRYYKIDKDLRNEKRREWNKPLVWPAVVLIFFSLGIIGPGIVVYHRKKRT